MTNVESLTQFHTDVLLLCAISVEWTAAQTLIEMGTESSDAGDPALRGSLTVGGRTLTAALVEVGMGTTEAALSCLTALNLYRPQLVVFVGIAGGVKDVKLGDVVIASKVHYYESGKAVDGEFRARPESPPAPTAIKNLARKIVRSRQSQGDFTVHLGPIASGEKVIADAESLPIRQIRIHYSDTIAVEMEGTGYFKAIDRSDVNAFVLIRGISDLIEGKSAADSAGWQEKASANAVAVTREFIERYYSSDSVRDGLLIRPTKDRVELSVASAESVPSNPRAQLRIDPAVLPYVSPNECYAMITSPGAEFGRAVLAGDTPLSVVFDLDSQPDRTGLLSQLRSTLERRRLLRLGEPKALPEPSLTSTSWVCVRGLDDSALMELSAWKRSGRAAVRRFNTKYLGVAGGRHVNLIVAISKIWEPWAQLLIDDLLAEFGENLSIISTGEAVAYEYDKSLVGDPSQLSAALKQHFAQAVDDKSLAIATASGPSSIDSADLAWLREDLSIVEFSAGAGDDPAGPVLAFLKGGEIEWSALYADGDVLRAEYRSWRRAVEGTLKNRRTLRMNLFHAPGAGGTTMARRTVFDLKESYPCVVVDRIRVSETSRRIDHLGRMSGLSVLCLIDSARVTDGQVNDLLAELHANSTSTTLLYVARRYSPPSNLSTAVYLSSRLDDMESDRFFDAYVQRAPSARFLLDQVRRFSDDRRNAFYFGLTAFEDEFVGLDTYVSHRIGDLSAQQEDALVQCCIALYYGQSGVPEYALAELLGLPATKSSALARALGPALRSLLWRSSEAEWRPTHHLIARQVLVFLGGGENSWRRSLTAWAERFSRFCLGNDGVDGRLMRLAQSVLIDRGRESPLSVDSGSPSLFSRLLEDIPSAEGAVVMLARAMDLVPTEPHFAAHVARFYAFKLRNYDQASVYARRARDLDPNDHVLHHVLGMVYRARVYDGISRNESMENLTPWVQDSAGQFSESRRIAPTNNEHAYISEVQLRLRVVDYAVRKFGTIANYLSSTKVDSLVIESIAISEDLLSRVRNLGDARNPSGYERSARGDLISLYGDYEKALQLFDALLSRADINRPVVRRQVVWTYLGRANREWSSLTEKAVARIVGLLEENFNEASFDGRDIRQWWRAIRYLPKGPSQDRVHEVMAYWRESERTVESLYCSYTAYAIDVLSGLQHAKIEMERLQRECSSRSIGDPRRTIGYDWLGRGTGVARLVHQSELGGWDSQDDFWKDRSNLLRVEARISSIKGPQSGTVEYKGMTAFFVPIRAGAERGRHDSALVSGYIAFTRDGPRLWNPELILVR